MTAFITLAGQDITNYSDQMSIDIQDVLGQSSGAGNSPLPQGRAGQVQFDTSLGPANSAVGAGTFLLPTAIATDTFVSRFVTSGWGSASDGQLWNRTAGTDTLSVSGNQGRITGNSGAVTNEMLLGFRTPKDVDVLVRITVGTVGNSDGVILRSDAPGKNHYYTRTSGTTNLLINKRVSGAASTIATFPLGFTITSGISYWQRFRASGTSLMVKAWIDGNPEPTNWNGTLTDSTITTGGTVGIAVGANPSGTDKFDSFTATNLSAPVLVRQGELIFRNSAGQIIWGGFATKYTDVTTAKDSIGNTKQNFTTINGVDYEGQLARIMVSESYSALTDAQIIKSAVNKYAPWIDTSLLPATGTFVFPVKNFRNVALLTVIQTIAGVTGYLIWVDFSKRLHYVSPASTSTAPFALSDKPDFLTSFPHNFQQLIIDDNSAINKVTFYGGKIPSHDFFQDVSPMANGNNKIFSLAYFPRPQSDGKFHATVNGAAKVIGFATGESTPANTLKSAGGLADALINPDAQNITFDIAPPFGATVLIGYQFEFPLTVVVTDQSSFKFFGPPYLESFISDSSVFDRNTAIQRCKVLLTQQSFGLVSHMIDCWQPGLQAGQLLKVINGVRGVNNTYLIQEVETEPLGAGNFVYHLTVGAWNWNLIDVLVKLAASTAVRDDSLQVDTEQVDVEQAFANASVSTSWAITKQTVGPYYARSSPVGDGHDSFPGFATISS